MALSSREISDILALWRDVDILTPFTLNKLTSSDKSESANEYAAREFNWDDKSPEGSAALQEELAALPQKSDETAGIKLFIVQLGIFEKTAYLNRVIALLREIRHASGHPGIDDAFYETNESGRVCMATVKVNHFGKIVPGSFHPSAAFEWLVYQQYALEKKRNPNTDYPTSLRTLFADYSAERLRHSDLPRSPSDLPPDTKELYGFAWKKPVKGKRFLLADLAPQDEIQVTEEFLTELNRIVSSLSGIPGYNRIRVIERVQKTTWNLGDGQFDPFYANFLGALSRAVRTAPNSAEVLSPALNRLFQKAFAGEEKSDILRDPKAFYRLADPKFQSLGRWPEDTARSLVCAQQAALGQMLSAQAAKPLIAVNGPPGTGKTTLLRELVADVVVRRAKRLAELPDITDSGILESMSDGGTALCPELADDFAIIVSSNTNLAVENISKEFPFQYGYKGRDYDYFGSVAGAVFDKDRLGAWGMISVPFGKKENMNRVYSALFSYDRSKGEKRGTLAQAFEKEAMGFGSLRNLVAAFEETRGRFEALLQKEEEFALLQGAAYKADAAVNGVNEAAEPFAEKDGIKAFGSMDFNNRARHLDTLYECEELQTVRTELFLEALELHKLTLLIHRGPFVRALERSLKALTLGMGRPECLSRYLGTFAFFCPVMSTTLAASVCRYDNFARSSIPWVFLDESSQVTPHSAAMLLQKARRMIVVGDPQQLAPVVGLPRSIIEMLADQRPELLRWAPHRCSLQTLADGAQQEGAQIGTGPGAVWTGLPLRAHRRCYPPMFNICNRISYQDQMVLDAVRSAAASRKEFIPSFWLDVRSEIVNTENYIPEEKAALEDVLSWIDGKLSWKNLEGKLRGKKSVMICSPYRHTANHLYKMKDWGEKNLRFLKITESGTVHTMQGRQADIVIMLMGGKTGKAGNGTRSWATEHPNLINVAVSRAIETFIVIGNAGDWEPLFPMDEVSYQLNLKGLGVIKSLKEAEQE